MARKLPDTGKLLEQWKSTDSSESAAAEEMLSELGPAPIIPFLRTPDEIKYLLEPIPPFQGVHLAGCLVGLNVILGPFTFILSKMFHSYMPIVVLIGAQVVLLMLGWLNRETLRSRAINFARKQSEQAGIAEVAIGLFESPQWDDAFLENLLLKQSDGPDLVRPPSHPVYPPVKRVLSRLDAQQAAILLPKHHAVLTKFLDAAHFKDHEELILLILSAIERFGTRQFVRKVKSMAFQGEFIAPDTRIRAAAASCLERMEQRFENEKLASRLLRPSESAAPESDLLVRPSDSTDSDSALLLRLTEDSAES